MAADAAATGAALHSARLGRVDYVNVLPVYLGLETLGTRSAIVRGVPTELNRQLRARAVDCAPVSAVEVAHARGAYAVLGGLSISSVGPVGSSLLISRRPPERLDGATVALTTHSAASLALFRVLCARLWRVAPRCVDAAPDLDAMLAEADGCVLIGNPALVAAERARQRGDLVVTDLGAAWHELTGLPAVFALWCVHADWARQHPDAVSAIRDDLVTGRAWGRSPANRPALLARAAADTGLATDAMDAYFTLQDYGLDEAHRRGLRRYLDEVAALGLAPGVADPEILT